MPKRKLVDFRDQPRTHNPPHQPPPLPQPSHQPSHQHDRLSNLLAQSKTALFRALKFARAFERQKLGRRQKTAAAEKRLDDVRRLKLEVAALKELDLKEVAGGYLGRRVGRVKGVKEIEGFEEIVGIGEKGGGKGVGGVERVNVLARLFKSEGVMRVVGEAVEGVKAVLGGGGGMAGGRGRGRDCADGQASIRSEEEAPKVNGGAISVHGEDNEGEEEQEEEEEWGGLSTPALSQDEGDALRFEVEDDDLSSVDGDNYEHYASRLDGSSDSDSESGATDYDSESLQPSALLSKLKKHTKPLKDTNAMSITPSPSPSPQIPASTRPPSTHKPPIPRPTSTTFLPTLQGGYYSGDSSASAPEDDPSRPQPRKNRMGQQARRALWEKKFKDRANHLKKQKKHGQPASGVNVVGKEERDQGWDARRGATGDEDRRGGKKRKPPVKAPGGKSERVASGPNRKDRRAGQRAGGAGGATGANAGNVGGRAKAAAKADGSLHPSWEAAKRAKEAKAMAKPAGKKVVF